MNVRHKRRNIFFDAIPFLFAIAVCACEHHTYTGTLSMRGNAPFPKLVLVTNNGTLFELVGDKAKELTSHQYAHVVIAGKEIAPAKGPGFPAQLLVVKIISISTK